MAKKGRLKPRLVVSKADRAVATPETISRLRPDPIRVLCDLYRATEKKQGLSVEDESAIYAIRAAVAALTMPVAMRIGEARELVDGRSLGDWPPKLAELIDRYCRWIKEMHRYKVSVIAALDAITDTSAQLPPLFLVKQSCAIWRRCGIDVVHR